MHFTPYNTSQYKKQEYIWLRGVDLNSFQNSWSFPVLCHEGIRITELSHWVMAYITFATV